MLPRLYREAPVNPIWEGSGNVMCLDVLRVLAREPQAARTIIAELAAEAADLPGAGEAAGFVEATLIEASLPAAAAQARLRAAVERLATLAAAAALRASAPARVTEVFAQTRLAAPRGATYGVSDISAPDAAAILERALPG
jgi:putative acyl-CoA dehydrogenase